MNIVQWAFGPPETVSRTAWYMMEGEFLTHWQFYKECLKVGQMLKNWGVKPGDHVLLIGDKSFDFLFNYIGILCAGAAVSPYSPEHSLDEIAYTIQKGRMAFVIAEQEVYDLLTANADKLPPTDLRLLGNAKGVDVGPFKEITIEDVPDEAIAQILWTSGTTGKPKGALISHGSYIADVNGEAEVFQMTEKDVVLGAIPLNHCYGVSTCIMCTLRSDANVTFMKKYSPSRVIEWVEEYGITYIPGVPFYYSTLVNTPSFYETDWSRFRLAEAGGAATPRTDVAEFKRITGVTVLETFGITECTSLVCIQDPNQEDTALTGSCGYPITGASVRIVDREDLSKELPPRQVGMIEVKGPIVMSGYLDDPEATAAAIRDGGWFVTGDLGYLTENGELFLAGRVKEMINRGGEKIFPIEVENVLRQYPGIRDAALIAVPDPLLGERVKAHIEVVKGAEIDTDAVAKFVAERLVRYKVPEFWAITEELPRNARGKIQKSMLK